ncbi:MAG: hypothetical protein ABSC45_10665 [Desulfobaccales bacterium]|jgi:hypothetical protein
MSIPLAKKIEGRKFMWDGGNYAAAEEARQVMEGYAKDGFEVEMFEEEGQFLIYSRRLAAAQKAG